VTFDLDLEHTLDARSTLTWSPSCASLVAIRASGHLSAKRSDLRKSLQTDGQRTDAAPLH